MKRIQRPLLVSEILQWADNFHQCTGRWPNRNSGGIGSNRWETWDQVNRALVRGLRGLPGGSSLVRLLAEHRGARSVYNLSPLTESQILEWADAHQQRTGQWPRARSGVIPGTHGETWAAVDTALTKGMRGLPGGLSLARFLAGRRGARNIHQLSALTEVQVLAWADAHFQRTGAWPLKTSGNVVDAPGETWLAIDATLRKGRRGLPGGSSLAQLLAQARGVSNLKDRPPLSESQILAWIDAHHQATGKWPTRSSGPIVTAPGESWNGVDGALRTGGRGLPGGSSLARILVRERGVLNQTHLPRLRRKQILAWADAYHRRTGAWPTRDSGPIPEAPGETWARVNNALRQGLRGLRGGMSLADLLAAKRGKRHLHRLGRLTSKLILGWAEAHRQRTGEWPTRNSGPIPEAPGEDWKMVDNALSLGCRGRPGGSSLVRFLARKRGVRNPKVLPPLSVNQILAWADAFHRQTGDWPNARSGPVSDSAGETWGGLDKALRRGTRSLAGGSSLVRLLAAQRGRRTRLG